MISRASARPIQFQKAMIFIDGTNLFYRLESTKLKLKISIHDLVKGYVKGRDIVRVYLYTVEQNLEKAIKIHETKMLKENIKIVYGDGIEKGDGNIKEKGVDALLVADLVYHAAVKNYDYALVVSTDTDFVHAIKRVEDFGCRSGVLAICTDMPQRLKDSSDDVFELSEKELLQRDWVVKM